MSKSEVTVIAGADGCKKGWIVVHRQPGRMIGSIFVDRIERLFDRLIDIKVLAIDIPIGLTNAGNRRCDLAAKEFLGKRQNSVFHAPKRAWLNAADHPSAVAVARGMLEAAPSIQSWCITPKIREIDELLVSRIDLRQIIFEIHPEVSFAAMAGAPMKTKKKDRLGRAERLALITARFGETTFASIRASYTKRQVGDDDLLDAFAALWSGERILNGAARTLPDSPHVDSAGLPMRIVY